MKIIYCGVVYTVQAVKKCKDCPYKEIFIKSNK